MWGDIIGARPTRRGLLAGLPFAILALGSGAGLWAAAGPVRRSPQHAETEIDRWSGMIGERFAVAGNPGWTLRLVSIEAKGGGSGRPHDAGRRRNFLAAFEAVGHAAPAGDETYQLSHPSMGRLPLFLGARDDGTPRPRFIAAFN